MLDSAEPVSELDNAADTLRSVLSRFVETFLFRVQARDPMVFIGVPILLGAVAFLAVWLPARRASRIDPIIALRTE